MRFADPCQEDPYQHHLVETEDGRVTGTTPCGAYTTAHIRLHRNDVNRWRRLRAQALVDLPLLTAVAGSLELIRSAAPEPDRQKLEAQIAAIRRRIDESKLRFGT